jgi:hypothetical protein
LNEYSVIFLTLLIPLKIPQTLQRNQFPLIPGLKDIGEASSGNSLFAAVGYACNIERSWQDATIFGQFDYQAMCLVSRRLLVQNLEVVN